MTKQPFAISNLTCIDLEDFDDSLLDIQVAKANTNSD